MPQTTKTRTIVAIAASLLLSGAAPSFAAATAIAPAKPSSEAPGRGIQPAVSPHSAAAPTLYSLGAQPLEHMSPLIARQYMNGAQSTFVRWVMKKGAIVPLHHHANEQITWITSGSCEVYSGGRKYILKAGDVMIIPPNTPHEFVFTEDTIDIDIFAPQRQDWIDGSAHYLPN